MKKLNVHLTNIWISYPYKLYLFNDMLTHHITFADFGEFVAHTRINGINRQMETHVVSEYPGWNRDILDTTRAKINELISIYHKFSFPVKRGLLNR